MLQPGMDAGGDLLLVQFEQALWLGVKGELNRFLPWRDVEPPHGFRGVEAKPLVLVHRGDL